MHRAISDPPHISRVAHATESGPNTTNFIAELYFHNMKIKIVSFSEILWF